MENVVGAIVLGLIAIAFFVFACMHFLGKGFLLNNAYIYASKEEREKMDKKPHYKQSGIVFLLMGIVFAINAVDMVFQTTWLFYLVLAVIVAAIVYAIVSAVLIEKRKK